MAELRHRERPVHSIMIAGKPSFTLNLARMLKTGENRPGGDFDIRILENDRNVVKRLSRELGDAAMLIEGDFTSEDVLDAAGIKDIRTKCLRSNNPNNVVAAAFEGLKSMRGPEEVARIRGKSVEEIVG